MASLLQVCRVQDLSVKATFLKKCIWEFPKVRGTILEVPIIRTINILGSILGSPYFGKLLYDD